jgi:transposase
MDITVYQSDAPRPGAPLPPRPARAALGALRGRATRPLPRQPRPAYYEQLAARIGGNRACLALARKLLKRSYHLLKALGDQALAPVA